MSARVRARCRDCGVDTLDMPGGTTYYMHEYYMVHDEVWAEAGMGPLGGFLCIGCLSARLGRHLTGHDFIRAPINWPGSPCDSPRIATLKYAAWRVQLPTPAEPLTGRAEQLSLALDPGGTSA